MDDLLLLKIFLIVRSEEINVIFSLFGISRTSGRWPGRSFLLFKTGNIFVPSGNMREFLGIWSSRDLVKLLGISPRRNESEANICLKDGIIINEPFNVGLVGKSLVKSSKISHGDE